METNPTKKSRSSMSNNSGSVGGSTTTTAPVERKEIERRRRQHMKSLCVKLASLIPKEHYSSKDAMTQLGSLDEAATYINKLKERVEELRQKRTSARLLAAGNVTRRRGGGGGAGAASTSAATTTTTTAASSGAGSSEEQAAGHREDMAPAVVEVRQHSDGSSLEVVLISSVERPFKLHEVITVLQEEGAETTNANFSVAGTKIFYTIHCKDVHMAIPEPTAPGACANSQLLPSGRDAPCVEDDVAALNGRIEGFTQRVFKKIATPLPRTPATPLLPTYRSQGEGSSRHTTPSTASGENDGRGQTQDYEAIFSYDPVDSDIKSLQELFTDLARPRGRRGSRVLAPPEIHGSGRVCTI